MLLHPFFNHLEIIRFLVIISMVQLLLGIAHTSYVKKAKI